MPAFDNLPSADCGGTPSDLVRLEPPDEEVHAFSGLADILSGRVGPRVIVLKGVGGGGGGFVSNLCSM